MQASSRGDGVLARLSDLPRRIAGRCRRAWREAFAPLRDATQGVDELEDPDEEQWAVTCAHSSDFNEYMHSRAALFQKREVFERACVPRKARFFLVLAYCAVCGRDRKFHCDVRSGQTLVPNWREQLVCQTCKLPNRQRAVYDFLDSCLSLKSEAAVYLTERKSPFFKALARRYPGIVGSEFLGTSVETGTLKHGIRNEDITRLTFADRSFDAIITTDVLEHVPNYAAALAECFRCLRAQGYLIATVPFILTREQTVVRARKNSDGIVEHCLPPEYHGDPLNPRGGVLCYYHFGWDLLEHMRCAGFEDVRLWPYWSARRGYMGGCQLLITARKL